MIKKKLNTTQIKEVNKMNCQLEKKTCVTHNTDLEETSIKGVLICPVGVRPIRQAEDRYYKNRKAARRIAREKDILVSDSRGQYVIWANGWNEDRALNELI